MDNPVIERDESGRISEAQSEGISGPLGIWPFPILNLIASNQNNSVEVTRINRDDNGRVESIEEIKI